MADTTIDDVRLTSIVKALVAEAEEYRDDRSTDREKAMAYYDGDEKDLQKYIPSDEGRSKVVSRDVRAAVRKVLPSVLRTILGHDEIVEYTPVGEGDEQSAEQATDYVNYVALPECNGRQAIEDAVNDALRLRNGIIKWWMEEKIEVKVSRHTGLDEMAFAQLVADDEVEVLEHTQSEEMVPVPDPETGEVVEQPVPVHAVKIKRTTKTRLPRIAAIAPENFLIHPDAIRLEDSPVTGENMRLRRSDLVAMGYDRDLIDSLPIAGSGNAEQESEAEARRRDEELRDGADDANSHAMQEVEFYDLLVRVDQDDDGIAELRRIVYAGAIDPRYMLENDYFDEVNYADIVSERRPHQWEGNSITDEVMEVQKVKTVLLRQTLDNLYWQNNLQPIYQEGQVVDPDAVNNPSFGKPIRVVQGVDVRAAVGYNVVPLVADKSFAMLEYMDAEVTDRTGISDASSGMAPDALQNMTAKASAMIEQAGIGQTEMMVKCIAESLKPVFKGLLRLIIQHQDIPRTVRLRDEWVTFDPRHWNADMDAIVNIGLGAGTRERDMMMMQQVMNLQQTILAQMGPAIGQLFVTVDNLSNGIDKFVEASGLRTPRLYFSRPSKEEVEQAMQAQSQQPSPEEIKAQSAMQLEEVRTQGKMQIEQFKTQAKVAEFQAKMQADASKEREQRDADLITHLQEIQAEAEARMEEAMLRFESDREGHSVDLQREGMKQQTEREWMVTQERIADKKLILDASKTAVQEQGKALDRQRQPDGNRAGRSGK